MLLTFEFIFIYITLPESESGAELCLWCDKVLFAVSVCKPAGLFLQGSHELQVCAAVFIMDRSRRRPNSPETNRTDPDMPSSQQTCDMGGDN